MRVYVLVVVLITKHHLASGKGLLNSKLRAGSKFEGFFYDIVWWSDDSICISVYSLHLFRIQVTNDSYTLLSKNIKNFIADIFFNNDNIGLNLSKFFFYDVNPIIFLLNKSLQWSPLRLISTNAILHQEDFRISNVSFHPLVGNVFGQHDSINVLRLRVVFIVNDFDLDEMIKVHGIMSARWRFDLLDSFSYKFK